MGPLAVVIAFSVAERLEFNSTKEQQFDPELLVDKITSVDSRWFVGNQQLKMFLNSCCIAVVLSY